MNTKLALRPGRPTPHPFEWFQTVLNQKSMFATEDIHDASQHMDFLKENMDL